MVCDRHDRRRQTLSGPPQAVWSSFAFRRRRAILMRPMTISMRGPPCAAGADSRIPRDEAQGARGGRGVGRRTPLREFPHVDDLARGGVFRLDSYDDHEGINRGAGSEICIRGLADRSRGRRHSRASLCSIRRNPTAPRANQWIRAAFWRSDGSRRFLSMTASPASIDGPWRTSSPIRRAETPMSHERLNRRLRRQTPAISS